MNLIYEKDLAQDYDLKRKRPWKPLISFLNQIEKKINLLNGRIIDLGCGNGRNFDLIKNTFLIGIDNSLEFLKIAKKRKINGRRDIELILSDMRALPFRTNSIDTTFSIASLHHVKRFQTRFSLINQLHEILKDGGFVVITVWRKYQRKFRIYFIIDLFKRFFSKKYKKQQEILGLDEYGDIIIPWKVSKVDKSYMRYYHLYSKSELKEEFSRFQMIECRKMGGPTKKDNFFALFKKNTKFHDTQ